MIIHAEGFEVGSTADLVYKGLITLGTSTKAITTGRNSPFGFRNTHVYNPPVGQNAAYYTGGGYDATLRWPVTSVIMGFSFRLNSPWNRNQIVPLMGIFSNLLNTDTSANITAGVPLNLYIAANGQLIVNTGNNPTSPQYTVPSGNFQAVADTWYYVEIQTTMTYSGGTGSNLLVMPVTIRVNGIQVGAANIAATAQGLYTYVFSHARLGYSAFNNNNNSVTTNFNNPAQMPASLTSTFSVDYDDWYVLDASRQPRANFLGPVVIKALRPTSDIVTGMVRNTGSSNFSAVADSTFDSDSTYVTASNVGDTDVYGVTTLTGTGAVYGVVMTAATRQISGAGRFSGVTRVGGVNYLSEARAVSSTAGYVANRFYMDTVQTPTRPDWDVTTVNSTGFGLTYETQN